MLMLEKRTTSISPITVSSGGGQSGNKASAVMDIQLSREAFDGGLSAVPTSAQRITSATERPKVAENSSTAMTGFSLFGAHQVGGSPRVSVDLMFCLNPNRTKLAKSIHLHTNSVLRETHLEPNRNPRCCCDTFVFKSYKNLLPGISTVPVGAHSPTEYQRCQINPSQQEFVDVAGCKLTRIIFIEMEKGSFKKIGARWLKWLEREFTDRKVRGSNLTSASRLPLSRHGQPSSVPALVLPSGGMAARHRKGVTAERFFV
ncbi:hypothetical protein CSKR_112272 [Clonorchis sinensis]|uniref:Uncharacterized protein n=1 Tax=Clonorchis sinensis TaxID=79923 RepID=A0A419Q7L1_CLOSI|nr:hypothetical protein CSKR_112272 [Clonorchis sinensis]